MGLKTSHSGQNELIGAQKDRSLYDSGSYNGHIGSGYIEF